MLFLSRNAVLRVSVLRSTNNPASHNSQSDLKCSSPSPTMDRLYLLLVRLWSKPFPSITGSSTADSSITDTSSDTRNDLDRRSSTSATSVDLELPGIPTRFPEPFLPPSECQPERICPPLPSCFPPVPINETPTSIAAAVRLSLNNSYLQR